MESFTKYYAVELRPYSAALAAAAAIPMVALWLALRPSWPRLVALAGVTVLVGTSSYTTAIAAVAGAGMLLAGWRWTQRTSSHSWLLAGVAILLITLPTIYLLTGRWQQSATSGPGYTQDLMLANGGLADSLRILSLNFISFTALPKTAFLITVPLAWLVMRARSQKATGGEGASVPLSHATVLLWIYVVITQVASLALSAAGVLPWIVGTRWSIGEIGIIAVSLVGLTSLLTTLISRPPRWLLGGMAGLAVIACAVGALFLASYERPERPIYEPFVVDVAERYPGQVIIDSWLFSDARYWIEFSGQYDSLRERWIEARPRENWPPVAIGADQIGSFLADPDAEVLIVRSKRVLNELVVASDWGVVETNYPSVDNELNPRDDGPVALIKEPD